MFDKIEFEKKCVDMGARFQAALNAHNDPDSRQNEFVDYVNGLEHMERFKSMQIEKAKTLHELPNDNTADYNRGYVKAMNDVANWFFR